MFDHTVPFYLGRTVTLVREQGELAWGIATAPANYIADLAEFERRWRADTDAYAIMGLCDVRMARAASTCRCGSSTATAGAW